MKYHRKTKQYRAGNLTYDTESQTAYSYNWYKIAMPINLNRQTLIILNSYNYSPTTLRHVYKLRKFFDQQNIQYTCIEAPNGLQDINASICLYHTEIEKLKNEINNPRCRKSLLPYRLQALKEKEATLYFVQTLHEKLINERKTNE